MNFKEAMGHFKNGFKIRRESWENKTYYLSRCQLLHPKEWSLCKG